MKKIISVITIIALVVTAAALFAACGKKEVRQTALDVFDGLNLVCENDETNTYSFKEGAYTEVYQGNTFKGTYALKGQTLYLTPNGQTYSYAYGVEYDELGYVTRLTQTEGRNFSVVTEEKK